MEKKEDKKKNHIFFWLLVGNANVVSIAGDFNGWKPEPMQKQDDGFYETVKLYRGFYQYKFVVDGEWHIDPNNGSNMINDFGSMNSVFVVS